MARLPPIELPDGTVIPVLYEDRAVLAIDKPSGWMLAPDSWNKTSRHLQLALESSLQHGDFWARARHLKFIRFIHRLDSDTSGILLLAKNRGVLRAYSDLFESRRVQKIYLAVVHGIPKDPIWSCELPLSPDPRKEGQMTVDPKQGKQAQTHFRLLQSGNATAVVAAQPITGRTHQIRVHLAAAGHPIVGDALYIGWVQRRDRADETERRAALPDDPSVSPVRVSARQRLPALALRAVVLSYPDPFERRTVRIQAPFEEFVRAHGFEPQQIAQCLDANNVDHKGPQRSKAATKSRN